LLGHQDEEKDLAAALRITRAYGRYFLLSREEEKDLTLLRIARAYGKYFNSALGKAFLKGLKEGESFTLRFEEEFLIVTKHEGRAIVEASRVNHPGSLFKYDPT
jgi:hypothetical protein